MPHPATGKGIPNAVILGTGAFVSRVLGLGRDLLIAFLLGPGADALIIALRIPTFSRRLLAEGSLGIAYAAQEARITAQKGQGAAHDFGVTMFWQVFLLSLPIMLFCMAGAWFLVWLLAPGAAPSILARSTELLRFCLPYLPFSFAAAIGFAHSVNAGHFHPQAWASSLLNICILLCGALALALQISPAAGEILLCLGLVCGGLLQWIIGFRCFQNQLSQVSFSIRKAFMSNKTVRSVLVSLPAQAVGTAPHQLHALAGMLLASYIAPGGISALYFAERLTELPLGIAGVAIGMSALPRLTATALRNDHTAFSKVLSSCLSMTSFLSLPASVGLFTLATPFTNLFFGHGAYTLEALEITASALQGYAAALPAICATRPLLSAAHALNLGKIPLRTALKSLGILVIVGVPGLLLAKDNQSAAALNIGLGLAAAAWGNAFLLLMEIRKKGVSPCFRSLAYPILSYLTTASLMGWGLTLPVVQTFPPGLLILLVGLCALAWLGLFHILGYRDALDITAFFSQTHGKKEP